MSLEWLTRRVNNMLIAAVLCADRIGGGAHRGQFSCRAEELKSGIRILTPYGFAVRLLPAGGEGGPETVILAVEPDLRYALPPTDPRYAPDDLAAGEVALYTDEDKTGGCRIHLKRGRVVEIKCDTAKITADTLIDLAAPKIRLSAAANLVLDCSGYGTVWAVEDGRYHVTNYFTGPVDTSVAAVTPPQIP